MLLYALECKKGTYSIAECFRKTGEDDGCCTEYTSQMVSKFLALRP